jgi:hypothetical protein
MAYPAKYNPDYHDDWGWSLAIHGADDKDIASAMHITRQTLYRWKFELDDNRKPKKDENGEPILTSFGKALSEGKDISDSKTERSLYKSGLGYYVEEEERTIEVNKDGSTKLGDLRTKKKYIPPNVTAQIFWLKNRKKEQWRDVTRNEVTGADGKAVEFQQVQVYLPEKERLE